jgi:hypothetical protein
MAGMAVQLASGANALETAEGVKAADGSAGAAFPRQHHLFHPYDTSLFVSISIEEVLITLAEAIVLVFIVMFVFLQNSARDLHPHHRGAGRPARRLHRPVGARLFDQRADAVRHGAGDRHSSSTTPSW